MISSRRLLLCTLVAIGLWLVFALQAFGYVPPDGPNGVTANLNAPHGHGTIILQALAILAGDSHADEYAFYNTYRQQLLDGARKADEGEGAMTIPVLGTEVSHKSYSHFYNPATGQGFQLHLPGMGTASLGSLAPWKYFTLKGPHTAGTDMTDWLYAQAVQEMRAGNVNAALTDLGEALHLLADCTVPQHATDQGAERPFSHHVEYEAAVDAMLGQLPKPTSGGLYHLDWRPDGFTAYAAQSSAPYLEQAKSTDTATNKLAAQAMVPLAERLSAGLLDRFFQTWSTEDFSVAVLTISHVKAIPGYRTVLGVKVRDTSLDLDSPDEADFYAKVWVNNREYDTGVVDGADDMYPNILSYYDWVFPNWVSGQSSAIPLKIQIWDQDTVTADDHADINSAAGNPDLSLTYNLGTNALTGDLTAPANYLALTSQSSSGTIGDGASLDFVCQRVPTLPGVACTVFPASPRYVGASITLTASCTLANAQYKFCISSDNGATWTDLGPYRTVTGCTWWPARGEYLVKAKALVGGVCEGASQPLHYSLQQPPLSAVSLGASPTSPRLAQTPITLTATPSGGQNVQYKFRVSSNNGGTWTDLRAFQTGNTFVWTPAATGAYLLSAVAREGTAGANFQSASVAFSINPPLTGVALSVSPASPKPTNTAVTLHATPTGGAQLEYAFSAAVGGTSSYSNLGGWQTAPTYVWQNLSPGTFTLRVTAREVGTTQTFEATVTYTLTKKTATAI